jgi:hypothetical protein
VFEKAESLETAPKSGKSETAKAESAPITPTLPDSQFAEPAEFSMTAPPITAAAQSAPEEATALSTETVDTPETEVSIKMVDSSESAEDALSVVISETAVEENAGAKPKRHRIKSRRRKLKIVFAIAGGVLTLALVAGIILYNMFYNQWLVRKALINFGEEFMSRVESSPVNSFLMFNEMMKDGGMLSADFSGRVDSVSANVSGNVSIFGNENRGEYALHTNARATVFGFNIADLDASFYANRNRLVFESSLLENNYGLSYSTFGEDIRPFGEHLGLDPTAMDFLTEYVSFIENSINNPTDLNEWRKPYTDLLIRHLRSNEDSHERNANVRVGRNDDVRTRKIVFAFDRDDVAKLLWDVFEIIKTDDYGLGLLNQSGMLREDFLRELEEAIRRFERDFDVLEISLAFFINRGRLIQLEIDYDANHRVEHLTYNHDSGDFDSRRESVRTQLLFRFNLGTAVDSPWTLTVREGRSEILNAEWRFGGSSSSRFRHEVIVNDHTVLDFDWTPSNGDFTLLFDHGEMFSGTISGSYLPGDDGFRFNFGIGDRFSMTINAERGVAVPAPESEEFINIADWATTLAEELKDTIFWTLGEAVFDLLGGSSWRDYLEYLDWDVEDALRDGLDYVREQYLDGLIPSREGVLDFLTGRFSWLDNLQIRWCDECDDLLGVSTGDGEIGWTGFLRGARDRFSNWASRGSNTCDNCGFVDSDPDAPLPFNPHPQEVPADDCGEDCEDDCCEDDGE